MTALRYDDVSLCCDAAEKDFAARKFASESATAAELPRRRCG
jgi:hypothetical protein